MTTGNTNEVASVGTEKPSHVAHQRLVGRSTGKKCICGGNIMASQVAVWCDRVKFENGGIAGDSPCDNAIMSG